VICYSTEQLQAFYDGELPVEKRMAIAAHVNECAACREVVAELDRISQLIGNASLSPMPSGMIGRLNDAWDAASDGGVLRIAGWLTAAAAAILVAAVLHAPGAPPEPASPAVWPTYAAMSPEQVQDSNRSEIVLAQWMADDLSTGMPPAPAPAENH
jgi:anti-sigma factor RsiW